MRSRLVFAAAGAICLSPLRAEELPGGVALPGLESDPPQTALPGDCAVSVVAGHISIDLSLTVGGESALLLEGPLFGWNGPTDPYPDRQFPELTFGINGEPRAANDRFEAFAGTRDVTTMVQMAGMDPWAITHSPPLTAVDGAATPVLTFLSRVGAIERSGAAYLAKWQARRILRVPLEARQVQHAQWDYQARPAKAVIPALQLDTTTREKAYCLSPNSLPRLTRNAAARTWLGVSEFSIATGIDGKPPHTVTLSMSPATGDDAKSKGTLFMCGPHGKSIATQHVLTRERAEVDESGNLRVLLVVKAAPP